MDGPTPTSYETSQRSSAVSCRAEAGETEKAPSELGAAEIVMTTFGGVAAAVAILHWLIPICFNC